MNSKEILDEFIRIYRKGPDCGGHARIVYGNDEIGIDIDLETYTSLWKKGFLKYTGGNVVITDKCVKFLEQSKKQPDDREV